MTLGAASVLLAAGLTGWLTLGAGPNAAWLAGAFGTVATAVLVVALLAGRFELAVGALALLGSAYTAVLVVDDPPLDTRAAIVGAALLSIGELACLSVGTRSTVPGEAGAAARRLGSVSLLALGALLVGGGLIAAVDVLRTGGLGIEVVGTAAVLGAVGVLVAAARAARET